MVVDFLTHTQQRGHIAFQVADAKRPLLAASTLARVGNGVTIGTGGGKIVNRRSGKCMSFVKRGGIYILEVLVAPHHTHTQVPRPAGDQRDLGFVRHGADGRQDP